MSINFNISLLETQVIPKKFFEGLSKKDPFLLKPFASLAPLGVPVHGYEKHFRISPTYTGRGMDYQVFEMSKPWFFNPFKLLLKKDTIAQRIETAKNLAGLFQKYASQIANDPNCNVRNILNTLDRYKLSYVKDADRGQQLEIINSFNRAIQCLQVEHAKVEEIKFRQGNNGFNGKIVPPQELYRKLASKWWPFGLRWPLGFHQKIHIIKTGDHRYEVRLVPKRWFFQKWVAWPTEYTTWRLWKNFAPKPATPASKVVTAELLKEMIIGHATTIEYMELNTSKMIANLETIRDKMLRNTVEIDRKKIKEAFDGAIVELVKCGSVIDEKQQNSWKKWALDRTAAPAGRAAIWTGQKTAGFALGIIKLPYYIGKEIYEQLTAPKPQYLVR